MKGKFIAIMVLLLGVSYFLYNPNVGNSSGKDITIKGVVVNEKNVPITEASVLLQGTIKKTFTNYKGEFSIDAQTGKVLAVRHSGYRAKEVPVTDSAKIKVILIRPDSAFKAHVAAIKDSLEMNH